MILVLGGSASGKSEFAENLLTGDQKIYIATMMPQSDQATKRIEKHVNMRKNKNFETFECYFDLKSLELPEKSSVILECIGNLVANEMFYKNTQNVVNEVLEGIYSLKEKTEQVVLVSNNIFEDGIKYDQFTEKYIQNVAEINMKIAEKSSKVYDIVCGIPILVKGENCV